MIDWWWVIISFIVGGEVGFFVAGILHMASMNEEDNSDA